METTRWEVGGKGQKQEVLNGCARVCVRQEGRWRTLTSCSEATDGEEEGTSDFWGVASISLTELVWRGAGFGELREEYETGHST